MAADNIDLNEVACSFYLEPHAERGRPDRVSFSVGTAVSASVENGFLPLLPWEAPAKKNGRISSVCALRRKARGERRNGKRLLCLSLSIWG